MPKSPVKVGGEPWLLIRGRTQTNLQRVRNKVLRVAAILRECVCVCVCIVQQLTLSQEWLDFHSI
jgi:hypothetical protein